MDIFQRWKQAALHNKALVISGALVAFGTFFYAAAAAVQVYILKTTAAQSSEQISQLAAKAQGIIDTMNRALSDSRTSIARAFDENKRALDASQSQSKHALDATVTHFRLDQRAWLGTREFRTLEFSKDKGLLVDIIFSNSGKTPAKNVEQAVNAITSPVPIAGPTPAQDSALVFFPGQAIPPQGTFVMRVGYFGPGKPTALPTQLTSMQDIISKFELIDDQKMFLYYFGRLRYKDMFGNVRNTQFCILLVNPKTKDLGYCDAFNDLD